MSDEDLMWKVIDRTESVDFKIFSTYRHTAIHPPTGRQGQFSVVDSPNWVNVIAVTADEQVVMVRQYRHGVQRITLEIPGGMVDPGEDFVQAARRELREETGFEASEWRLMGAVDPNPAFMNNTCGLVVARNAVAVGAQALDPNEAIDVALHPLSSIDRLIRDGVIAHTLVISAFHLLRLEAADVDGPRP